MLLPCGQLWEPTCGPLLTAVSASSPNSESWMLYSPGSYTVHMGKNILPNSEFLETEMPHMRCLHRTRFLVPPSIGLSSPPPQNGIQSYQWLVEISEQGPFQKSGWKQLLLLLPEQIFWKLDDLVPSVDYYILESQGKPLKRVSKTSTPQKPH